MVGFELTLHWGFEAGPGKLGIMSTYGLMTRDRLFPEGAANNIERRRSDDKALQITRRRRRHNQIPCDARKGKLNNNSPDNARKN